MNLFFSNSGYIARFHGIMWKNSTLTLLCCLKKIFLLFVFNAEETELSQILYIMRNSEQSFFAHVLHDSVDHVTFLFCHPCFQQGSYSLFCFSLCASLFLIQIIICVVVSSV